MTRAQAIAQAERCFDSGAFRALLARRLAMPTESQNPERAAILADYLETEIRPAFEALGFACRTLTHPKALAPFRNTPSASRTRPCPRCWATATATSSGAWSGNGRKASRLGR